MLSTPECMKAVAKKLLQYKPQYVVIDPVMYAKNGCPLMNPTAVFHLDRHSNSTGRCTYSEYSRGRENSGYADFHSFRYGGCRKKIYAMGCKAIVVKGGHHIGNAVDVLFDGENFYHFETSALIRKILMGQAVPFLLQSLPSLQREKVFRLQSNLQRLMSQWQSNTLLRLKRLWPDAPFLRIVSAWFI